MDAQTHYSEDSRAGALAASFQPLAAETRTAIDTEAAAFHLSRKPQTLRIWACRENGPLRPLRVHGRLLWRVADIRRLLGVESA